MECNDPGSSHRGARLKLYTSNFKLKVLATAKSANNRNAAKPFGVDRKRVIEWRKQEDVLTAVSSGPLKKRQGGAGRKVSHPDISRL